MSLENKVAIVTGAGQGIGRGIALELAKQGCRIIVSDLNLKNCKKVVEEIEKDGGQALSIKCDVSKQADVKKMIDKTVGHFGSLDILVNNAGIYPFVAFEKMKEKDWDKVMAVNVRGVFLTSSEAVKKMKQGGRIINISSIAGFVAFNGLTHYCASKGAVNAFARTLAVELAPKKITVNNVAPGAIETPGATGAMTEDMKKQTMASIPMARMGLPEDIANAVTFLASSKSDYITGQTIIVDGGWTLR